jgi:sigma-B regulation protein RsbU (phosphoserine phosphatase)
MDQHKLYRTIQVLAETPFRTDDQLIAHVLESIIKSEQEPIRGGRIWKLEVSTGTYRLIHQIGEMEAIDKNFRIRVADYPLVQQLPRKGTVIGRESNPYLLKKGIKTFSATGVGEKLQWKTLTLYQYIIAITAAYVKEEMTYALNIIGSAMTAALKNRKAETKARQLEADLDKARDIQKSILPAHELRFHNYDIYGVSLPDRVVGGDFFDYLHAAGDKERLGIVIGDAASKGLSAASQALYVSGALRMGVEFQVKIGSLVTRLNALVNRAFKTEQFISMVYAELNASDRGLVIYINAGHNNPFVLRSGTNDVEKLVATGQILGPFPKENYHSDFTILRRGDIMLLYTDGIVEAPNERGEMFGEARLMHALRQNRKRTPRELCALILEEVQVYSKMADYSDDKTIVVIKRSR